MTAWTASEVIIAWGWTRTAGARTSFASLPYLRLDNSRS